MKFLVCGGAGFIGSNFIIHSLEENDHIEIINIDKLTYAGNLLNLDGVKERYSTRYMNYRMDICDMDAMVAILLDQTPDVIINFAAESHVDRSILDASSFVKTNIEGVHSLLMATLSYERRKKRKIIFVQISTDEVYGSLELNEIPFTEESALRPSNPYAATKASADLLCASFHRTYEMDIRTVRPCNNFGPRQFPEKFIPLSITRSQGNKKIPIYGNGKQIRQWLYVDKTCDAILKIIRRGRSGNVYNLSGKEISNREIASTLLRKCGRDESMIIHVQDRPGHDFRYAMTSEVIQKECGWDDEYDLDRCIDRTVEWYLDPNRVEWLKNVDNNDEHIRFMNKNYKK